MNSIKKYSAQGNAAAESKCRHSALCGGCAYMDTEYGEQLARKQSEVERLIRPFGKVLPIVGAENPYHYRNKVHAVISGGRRGEIYAGTYEAGTHRVVDVESCLIDNAEADSIIRTVVSLMKSFKYTPYNEDTGRGFLRHILVRTAHATGQIMVVLVTADKLFPSKNNFVRALLAAHPSITTIVANLNSRRTSMVLGDYEQVLYGKGFIEDELCGCRFKLSPKSFYQVNSAQTQRLYSLAIEYAGLNGSESVIDAYSGIGTVGIIASRHAKSVTGIELNADAVRDSQINSRLNNCKNVKYLQGDAGEFMLRAASEGRGCDVVFTDPPRSGSSREFLEALSSLAPERVVYISCNPETLAADLKYLTQRGYKMDKCRPVDMFPWTGSIECVVLLRRRTEGRRI
ncbi:MAG: 23S rRNA (uracil(1939)-C(5))-methyltransferase RlmD [Butyrivibrio sp.]|nr:23S rRNA (uracil(1939)-C(5))-methyltransferase RlmD [Butyrivibrio sp.]